MGEPGSSDSGQRRRRTRLIIAVVLGLITVLTAVQVLIQQLRFPSPIPSNILIFALVNVNLILLILLILLLFRNLFKIYLERRYNLLGSKFRVKLVVTVLSLALLPAALLFLVASNLITTSVDSWFNIQVEESLERSLDVAETYYRTVHDRALGVARQIARRIADEGLLDASEPYLHRVAKEKLQESEMAVVQIFDRKGRERVRVTSGEAPEDDPALGGASPLVRRALAGREQSVIQSTWHGDLVRGIVPIVVPAEKGEVVGAAAVGYLIPGGMGQKATDITTGIKEYKQLKMLKNPIKGIYIMLFLMVTLVIIFAAVWVGVHMARRITVPIQELAEGTRAVAAGNLEYRVRVEADDEIGMLVDSFNRMTEDLHRGELELTETNRHLQRTNVELNQRRAYMETVLESIGAGVLSVDAEGLVNTVNRAASRMLDLHPAEALHRHYRTVFAADPLTPLCRLMDRMVREGRGTVNEQVTLSLLGRGATFVVNVSSLRDREGQYLGMVVVFDDITQVIRAQQAMAWGEVARRMTHEIKNPLTPIKLSTQRLRKKFAERSAEFAEVFDQCTQTIIHEVDALKALVDEFSRYARMPMSVPRPGDLHALIAKVLDLYSGITRGIVLTAELDPQVPAVNFDPDHMKRALVNLVDNAVAAVGDAGQIYLRTHYLPDEGKVHLEVTDTGPGIPAEDRDRLFLPYFSTKTSGTGLGLAIVYRIVAEHSGTIRVEANHPRGTRMIMEFPALPVVAEVV
ncbi:MAG TPA: ATP-binding protein [Candidatus Methylomirabilis sp.]|nr:ATP-binding protein [Candidatus Methylomirabilis sp.]